MTQTEIQALARAAGFSEQAAPVASAIAMAESGGNPRAHNPRPPDDSYGLWQINMLGQLGPARRAQFGLRSNADLFDPAMNARAAYVISSGGRSFRPWTTYTSGAYRRFLTTMRPLPAPVTQGQAAAGQKHPLPGSDGGASTGLPGDEDITGAVPLPEGIGSALPPALIIAALAIAGYAFTR